MKYTFLDGERGSIFSRRNRERKRRFIVEYDFPINYLHTKSMRFRLSQKVAVNYVARRIPSISGVLALRYLKTEAETTLLKNG